jgi:hypothetical protein
MMEAYRSALLSHYAGVWGPGFVDTRMVAGPVEDLGDEFGVFVFRPSKARSLWTYATHGMSSIELHLFSPVETVAHVELLTAISHYHLTTRLDLGHTVNFGRPWLPGSKCEFGLVSLPLMDGPKLERLDGASGVRCYWLIPITSAEREFKVRNGVEALEDLFQKKKVLPTDPMRSSAV